MTRPLQKLNRGTRAFGQTLLAPTGGWNERDALAAMKPEDAVLADNVDIEQGFIASRPGYVKHATSVGVGNVETLFELWNGQNRALLAAMSTAIFNVSSANTAGTLLKGGFTGSGIWHGVNFAGTALFVEDTGTDFPQETSDGSSVSSTGFTSSVSSVREMIHINVWKERVWLTEKSSQTAHYGIIGGIAGSISSFPVGRIGSFGGDLIGTYSWSIDAGAGPDDLLVFLFSSGDIAVYSGIDPNESDLSVSTALQIIGQYRIGEPIDRRAVLKAGGDLIVLSKEGYLPLSKVIREGQIAEETKALSEKIRNAVQAAAETGKNSTGWQAMLHPRGTRLYFNVPTTKAVDAYNQHVFHPASNAWSRYKNIPARSLGKFEGEVYYGGVDGTIWRQTGTDDNGAQITSDVQQAWSYFGQPAVRKQIHTYEPLVEGVGSFSIETALMTDFNRATPSFQVGQISGAPGPKWDATKWNTSKWGRNELLVRYRFMGSVLGHSISLRLRAKTTTAFRWYATSWTGEVGGLF